MTRLVQAENAGQRANWRNRVVTMCLPVADNIAYRFVGRGEPADDLMQVARLGLVKAVDRFDPGRGHFLAFAVPTIRGELLRHFRDHGWMVHVPRAVQEMNIHCRAATDVLCQRLGSPPTPTQVAAELGVDGDDVREGLDATSAYHPVSLDAPVSASAGAASATVGALHGVEDPGFDRVDDMAAVAVAIAELDHRRRSILRLIFFEGLTQREAATRLGISQVHVSRLLNDALDQVRVRVCGAAHS
ncbi:sigma-70 family RNA polymerase sigma factor [Mycolicibacterium sp. 3033]|nr:sigma-70 family RNA polymerase sigma factor [Mycolicibacterium aurantiacum]